MSVLLWIAGGLVFLAGLQLFVFTERTDRFFAWTIDPPLTAAFLGAGYWASVAIEWSAARRSLWAEARIAVPAVFTFTVLTLIVTLVHRDRFHFGSEFEPVTQSITWAWLGIYTIVPVVMAVLWIRQASVAGTDPERGAGLAGWLRGLVLVQAVALGLVGLGLLVAPETTLAVWPWTLTVLTARAIGAWLVSLAVVAGHALWENSLRRLRPSAWAFITFGVLQAVALARYPADMTWTSASGIIYLAFIASTLVVGLAADPFGTHREA